MSATPPRQYAREKQSLLRPRWAGEYQRHLLRAAPIAFPNAPAPQMALVMLGFTAFSTGMTENTTEAVATQPFHEVGPFQVPAGPRIGPAPNPNPSARDNAWGRLANTDLVKRMNEGRAAVMTPDGWKRDLSSSVAVGIANLLDDEASFRRLAGPLAGDPGGWSHWRIWTMFTAFSRGPSQANKCVAFYRAQLLAVPESARLRTLRSLIVADVARRASGIGGKKGKMGAAYAVLRSDQKLESAVLFARNAGLPLDLLTERYADTAADAEVERVLSQTGEGNSVTVVADRVAEVASHAAAIAVQAAETPAGKIVAVGVVGAGVVAGAMSLKGA